MLIQELTQKQMPETIQTPQPDDGSSFLYERNPNLHASQEVEDVARYLRVGGDVIPNEPTAKISAYLGFLANKDYVNDGILTGDQDSIGRQVEAHAIKPEDVPDSYFELDRRIAREEGHGNIEITPEMRSGAARIISNDQRHSLKPWAEYLASGDAEYPGWFKSYAFDSVTRMGKLDKQKQEFQKRSNFTTVPFPELIRGSLSQVYSWVKKSRFGEEVRDKDGVVVVDGETGQPKLDFTVKDVFDDPKEEADFQKALRGGNFAKLYVQAIHKTHEGMITPEQREQLQGSWKKYLKGSDPRELHGDLQGFGLDWCTSTGFETAAAHIRGGDFYVFYTRDTDGTDRVPRVAVRMKDDVVGEVRGINPAQELEPEMANVVSEKLKALPGGEEYVKKAADMKRLTKIDKLITADPDHRLSLDEVRFLYEIDHTIEGFGYNRDPRIREVRNKRQDRDKPELIKILPEMIREQVRSAYDAYSAVEAQLNGGLGRLIKRHKPPVSRKEFEQLFAAKDKEWQENGVYDTIVNDRISQGLGYNLLATPNVVADPEQISSLVKAFHRTSRKYRSVRTDNNPITKDSHYTARDISRTRGDAAVELSLMQSWSDQTITGKPVAEQLRILREKQGAQPNLHVRIPSVLNAVAHWYALEVGGQLAVGDNISKTRVSHIDLKHTYADRGWSIPVTMFDGDGGQIFPTPVTYPDVRLMIG